MPHILSAAYQLLIMPPDNHQPPCLGAWENDIKSKLSPRQRQNILYSTYKSSICTRIQETKFKIVTRWYNTLQNCKRSSPPPQIVAVDVRQIGGQFSISSGPALNWSSSGRQSDKLPRNSQNGLSRMTLPSSFSAPPTPLVKFTKNP